RARGSAREGDALSLEQLEDHRFEPEVDEVRFQHDSLSREGGQRRGAGDYVYSAVHVVGVRTNVQQSKGRREYESALLIHCFDGVVFGHQCWCTDQSALWGNGR